MYSLLNIYFSRRRHKILNLSRYCYYHLIVIVLKTQNVLLLQLHLVINSFTGLLEENGVFGGPLEGDGQSFQERVPQGSTF